MTLVAAPSAVVAAPPAAVAAPSAAWLHPGGPSLALQQGATSVAHPTATYGYMFIYNICLDLKNMIYDDIWMNIWINMV